MPIYNYTAKDKTTKTVTGVIEAASESEVIQLLHKNELTVVSLKPAKKKLLSRQRRGGRVKMDDLVIFARQLVTLINSGIPLVSALGILIEQVESPNLKDVLFGVRGHVESGMSFCDSLARYPYVFSTFFINMVRAGETSGMLGDVLERVATYLEKSVALARKVRSSLIYPAVVVTMAILITAVLLLKVVPTFRGIFDMLGGSLPFATRVLIAVSELARKWFMFLVIGLAVAGLVFRQFTKTKRGGYYFDKAMLKLPVLGVLSRKVAVARFSRTLSTLVKSGVSILNALSIVAKTSDNKVVEEAVNNSSHSVREGEPIANPLARSGVFPPMVTAMISVGEQTGKLEIMLTAIADFYDEQVDIAVAGLTSMIEPMVIAFLGVVIGGIVVALFLPIFQISQLIAH